MSTLRLGTPNWLSIRIRWKKILSHTTPNETFWDHDLFTVNERTLPLAEHRQRDLLPAFRCFVSGCKRKEITQFFSKRCNTDKEKKWSISSARPLGLLWCLNIVLCCCYANFASDILRDQNSLKKEWAENSESDPYFVRIFLHHFQLSITTFSFGLKRFPSSNCRNSWVV